MIANVAAADAPAAQLSWLAGELRRARGACDAVVAVGHHPVFSGGDHRDSEELKGAFRPLFEAPATRADVYVAGHDHTLIHLEAGGVTYVVSGAGSQVRNNTVATRETVWFADAPGFTAHSFNATHAATFYVSGVDGRVLHAAVKPLAARAPAGGGVRA
jgi:acid phosphatase